MGVRRGERRRGTLLLEVEVGGCRCMMGVVDSTDREEQRAVRQMRMVSRIDG